MKNLTCTLGKTGITGWFIDGERASTQRVRIEVMNNDVEQVRSLFAEDMLTEQNAEAAASLTVQFKVISTLTDGSEIYTGGHTGHWLLKDLSVAIAALEELKKLPAVKTAAVSESVKFKNGLIVFPTVAYLGSDGTITVTDKNKKALITAQEAE